MTVKTKTIQTMQLFDFKVVKSGSELPKGCLAVLEGYATLSDDKSNRNKHYYPKGFWDSVLKENDMLKEKLETKTFFGSFRHPDKEEGPIPEFGQISHNIRSFKVDDKGVFVTLDILDTAQGRELKPLIDYGSKLGISTRAYGEVDINADGYKTPILDRYMFVTWDLVSLPAFSTTRMNKISDSMEIEFDAESLKSDKVALLDYAKSLNRLDAQSLCDYTGLDFSEIKDSFVNDSRTEVEIALDTALDRIKMLEGQLSDSSKENEVVLTNKIALLEQEIVTLKTSKVNDSQIGIKDSLTFVKEKNSDLMIEIKSLRSTNDNLREAVLDKSATIKSLISDNQKLNEVIDDLKKENKAIRLVADHFEEELMNDDSITDNSKYHTTPAVGRKKIGTLSDENVELTDSLGGIRGVFTKLNKKE